MHFRSSFTSKMLCTFTDLNVAFCQSWKRPTSKLPKNSKRASMSLANISNQKQKHFTVSQMTKTLLTKSFAIFSVNSSVSSKDLKTTRKKLSWTNKQESTSGFIEKMWKQKNMRMKCLTISLDWSNTKTIQFFGSLFWWLSTKASKWVSKMSWAK